MFMENVIYQRVVRDQSPFHHTFGPEDHGKSPFHHTSWHKDRDGSPFRHTLCPDGDAYAPAGHT
jgi:hypothetical protein